MMGDEIMSAADTTPMPQRRPTPFILLLLGKVLLLIATIVVVWALYAYMHAYRLEWLGWFYATLTPLTNSLYRLVEALFTGDTRYKIRAAITDDLGQRSLFLLLLTAFVELTLYCLFKLVKALIGRATGATAPARVGSFVRH
jgi:hypothetical protein